MTRRLANVRYGSEADDQTETPPIPVVGSDMQYQVRRIYCVRRNYSRARGRPSGGPGNPILYRALKYFEARNGAKPR